MLQTTKSKLTEEQVIALSTVARSIMNLSDGDALEVLLHAQGEFIMSIQCKEKERKPKN